MAMHSPDKRVLNHVGDNVRGRCSAVASLRRLLPAAAVAADPSGLKAGIALPPALRTFGAGGNGSSAKHRQRVRAAAQLTERELTIKLSIAQSTGALSCLCSLRPHDSAVYSTSRTDWNTPILLLFREQVKAEAS